MNMTKLVCTHCHVELKPETNGTTVIEYASFGPYKVWDADTWKCPGCGVEIVAGFPDQPLRQDHYSKDFSQWLSNLLAKARRIEHDFEKLSDVPQNLPTDWLAK
jgi:predicted RNA-binding Zn-ribbon protein involved in translation (DUF1610 family)